MSALIGLVLLLILAAPVGIAAAYAAVKGPDIIAAIFGLQHRERWPRGIQEDDAPPRWRFDPLPQASSGVGRKRK